MAKAKIYYHDIGDYLSREEKLKKITQYKSFAHLPLTEIIPNEQGDWISMRNTAFESFIPLGDKDDKSANSFFVPFYSNGLKTQRDAWCYNSSKDLLSVNIKRSLEFYNQQRLDFQSEIQNAGKKTIKDIISYDPAKISWTRALEWDIEKNKIHSFESEGLIVATYRPFFKQHLYFSRSLNEMVYQMPKLFPKAAFENKVICISGAGGNKKMTALIANAIPDLHFNGDTQAFPLYYYEETITTQKGLFDVDSQEQYTRKDAISDFILERARKQYGLSASSSNTITKEDIFYYVYGFLHSKEYRTTFANDLKKMLPRLPLVEEVKDFWAFSKAGRQLADLHLNYETVPPAPGVVVFIDRVPQQTIEKAIAGDELLVINYQVEKMRFPKKDQKETILYNPQITIDNIPPKAYEYIVNGKSAIEWVMERYQITTHKESGIVNNPNDWATEVGNPRYILDLLLSVINVSLQTVEIVEGLPVVKFE